MIVIGGGQSGLAVGYYLKNNPNLSYLILDDKDQSGGAWRDTWDSLKLFSPARYSSLPGWIMPSNQGIDHAIDTKINSSFQNIQQGWTLYRT